MSEGVAAGDSASPSEGRPKAGRGVLFAIGAAVLGTALVLAGEARWGVALGPDGINYLAIARNLLAGQGFTDFDGAVSTLWPPLWPLLLAAASGLGLFDPLTVVGPLNALLFGATVFVVGRYLERRLASRFAARWATLVLAASLPLLEVSRQAMSEPAFLLFAALALFRTDRFLHGGEGGEPGDRSSLIRAAVWSALAWLTRYLGVAVVAAAAVLLRRRRGAPLARRLRETGLYTAIAAAPTALWLLRNALHTGGLTGHTRSVEYSWWGILADLGNGLRAFAAFDHGALLLPAAALSLAFAVFLGRRPAPAPPEGSRDRPAAGGIARVFAAFALGYLVLLYAAVMAGQTWHGLSGRFLAPLALPLLVLAAAALDELLRRFGPGRREAPAGRARRVFATGFGAVLVAAPTLWGLGQILPNARALARANSGEPVADGNYRREPWAGSETGAFLRQEIEAPDARPARLYSNLPLLAYLETEGRAEVRYLPADLSPVVKRSGGGITTPEARLARGLEEIEDGARIVWRREHGSGEYRRALPPAFRVTPGLRLVREFPDGAVWEVDRGAEPGPNRYRTAYDALAAGEFGEPAARGPFDLYQQGRTLALLREPCSLEDLRAGFSLHLHPSDPESLPEDRRQYGFENRDFQFPEHGVLLDGETCLALAPLPAYDLDRILVGQPAAAPAPWEAIVRPDRARYRAAYEALVSGETGPPAVRAEFDLYREESALLYFRPSCSLRDRRMRFFLHLYPADPASLAPERRVYGFENRDFDFREHGLTISPESPSGGAGPEHCLAIVPLPSREFARVATGQWRAGEAPSWTAVIGPGGAAPESAATTHRARYDAIAAGDLGEPSVRSFFDLYFDETGLTYFRAPCAEEETATRFFLHLFPADREALPEDRREFGFDNLDFDFAEHGAILRPEDDPRLGADSAGAKCLAVAPLPDYGIVHLRTGQWIRDRGNLWYAEFAPGE